MSIDRTNYNALVDDDGSNTVGSIWNKQSIKNVLLDPMDAAFVPTWQTYTPVWSGDANVQPVIGNGLLLGRYWRNGPWIEVVIVLQPGSTSVIGTSNYWMITLPVTPKLLASGQETTFRVGTMFSNGAAQAGMIGYFIGLNKIYVLHGNGTLWGPTSPFAWNAGCIFSARGGYEV
jgi:hypothetical protein